MRRWRSALGVRRSMAALALVATAASCHARATGPKVLVIGIDGMDFAVTRDLMARGKMPNFSRIAAAGGFFAVPQNDVFALAKDMTTTHQYVNEGVASFLARDNSVHLYETLKALNWLGVSAARPSLTPKPPTLARRPPPVGPRPSSAGTLAPSRPSSPASRPS